MRTRIRHSAHAFILALLCLAMSSPADVLQAQSLPRLFENGRPGATPKDRPVKPHQVRKARLRLEALDAEALVLNLFDNAERVVRRTKVSRPGPQQMIWQGQTDDGVVTFAVVNGKATGTAYLDGRSFEVTADADGDYTVAELNAAAFPPDVDPMEPDQPADLSGAVASSGVAAMAADGAPQVDVMVVWTPAARTAVGGTSAAIESLVLSAVANANLAYTNSAANVRLRLVYSGELSFTEGNISTDLTAVASPNDGRADNVHSLRNQYGADIVTLIGSGYAAAGACGIGYIMQAASTSFASNAFNVVDQSCAAGYLSYAHEVGHNQGIHHDPGNASSAPAYPYAYGYQDPGNIFRTVMAYGGATRVPYFSNPSVAYNSRPTGTSSQDNARALSNTATVVAAFRAQAGTPSCSYSVSPTSLAFQSGAASAAVTVTTTAGCAWSSSSNSAWMTASGSGSGSGSATVTVVANAGGSRSANVTVAGVTVAVSQAAAPPPPPPTCTYSVSPTSLSFSAGGGTATVSVTTAATCAWTSSSASNWAAVTGAGTGSGTATVSVAGNTAGGSRNATLVVAGMSVSVSQAGASKGKGGGNRR